VRGGGIEKAQQGMGMAEHEMCGDGGIGKTQQEMGIAEHGMTVYLLLP
jgi:hypothetical protein